MDRYGCSLRAGACGGGERSGQDCDVDEVSFHVAGRTASPSQEVRGAVVSFRARRVPELLSSALSSPSAQRAPPFTLTGPAHNVPTFQVAKVALASIASIAPLMGVPGFLFTRALSRDVEGECISRAIA